jgi:glutamate dehydrogenase
VHRRDDADPYLVVAADKGTAHLSDTANAVAMRRDFWLGDAFASGGSEGYDHKKYAITARGAWGCVLHNFGELGIDPERDRYTVAGIGDMSGDEPGAAPGAGGGVLSESVRCRPVVRISPHRESGSRARSLRP